MTELPNVYELDPFEWAQQITRVADQIKEAIVSALNKYTTPKDVAAFLQPIVSPYSVDRKDDKTSGLFVEAGSDSLFLGLRSRDWFDIVYHEDGYWWYSNHETMNSPSHLSNNSNELHQNIANRALIAATWGDKELINSTALEHNKLRAIGDTYLHQIATIMDQEDASAAALRAPLLNLLTTFFDTNTKIEDQSPDEHHSHFVFRKKHTTVGHILAVETGIPLNINQLADKFSLNINVPNILGITDHLNFNWSPKIGGYSISLILPAKKYENVAAYNYAAEWVVIPLYHLAKILEWA